jgi:hypothetical protein
MNDCSALHEILAYIPPYYSVVCKQWKQLMYDRENILYWLKKQRPQIRYFEHHIVTDDMLWATTSYGFAKLTITNICINLTYNNISMYVNQHY